MNGIITDLAKIAQFRNEKAQGSNKKFEIWILAFEIDSKISLDN